MSKNWKKIVGNTGNDQYEKRIIALQKNGIDTSAIEAAVEQTIKNLKKGQSKSLVIYGEPQSGKTEMMIALNARLLDAGYRIIVNLLTDSVDLLDQNLTRFRDSGLNPAPKRFGDLSDDPKDLKGRKSIVFCKKNARDLDKLLKALRRESGIIVIDDEADYASPNGNIQKPEYNPTKINKLISKLMGRDGIYIGVTATPARLDLNDTFKNESQNWVRFDPHPKYVGHDFFFPHDGKCKYRLHQFKIDSGVSEKAQMKDAILHYLCGVAELHALGKPKNYTMLVHTSGKTVEHEKDFRDIESTLATLSNPNKSGFQNLCGQLLKVAKQYAPDNPESIVEFVLRHIESYTPVKINSANKTQGKVAEIARPSTLFAFGVGGNIISRGVTFDNLLSMYFTRSVKGKFTQDTYIQRARMFGTRKDYRKHFQLWIPDSLMMEWSKCFVFHELALASLQSGAGVPVWLSDSKIVPTAQRSINKSKVNFEGGEMPFALFDYDEERIESLFERKGRDDLDMLRNVHDYFDSEEEFPSYVYNYLKFGLASGKKGSIAFHDPGGFGVASEKYELKDKKTISRKKGIFSNNEFKRTEGENPNARHHLKVFFNQWGNARLFYKVNGGAIKFMHRTR